MMRSLRFLSLYLTLSFVCASGSNGRVVIFGDSLSDNGNLFAITGYYPPAPYGMTFDGTGAFPGRFTDGQNWVDYLPSVAHSFGSDVRAATAAFDPKNTDDNATNFAIGGSTSGNVNVLSLMLKQDLPSFPAQISAYLTSVRGKIAADDLCVIWIGANDFGAAMSPNLTVKNILNGITQLSNAGAKKIVVIDLPDLSLTPLVRGLNPPPIQEARSFVYSVNVALEVEIPFFALLNRVEVELVDINRIFVPIVSCPHIFGFTNSVDAALNLNTGVVASDPNAYVFWDGFHPTTKVHLIAAKFIYKSILLRQHFHYFSSLPIAD